MDLFWKTVGAALISAILTSLLERQNRDYSIMLTVAASAMVSIAAAKLMEPVLSYLGQLEALGNLSSDLLLSLIKVFGIGMTGEIAASVCNDAGNTSLGKGLRFLANAAILYVSVPIYASLTDLFLQILGDV